MNHDSSVLLRPVAAPFAGASPSKPMSPVMLDFPSVIQQLLALPFDALRTQYASAVMAGVTQRSLQASARWERAADMLEKLMLGPLARQR